MQLDIPKQAMTFDIIGFLLGRHFIGAASTRAHCLPSRKRKSPPAVRRFPPLLPHHPRPPSYPAPDKRAPTSTGATKTCPPKRPHWSEGRQTGKQRHTHKLIRTLSHTYRHMDTHTHFHLSTSQYLTLWLEIIFNIFTPQERMHFPKS